MISTQDRIIAVELINEAVESGARLKPACEELNITDRTYQRWTKEGEVKGDQRPIVDRPSPKNKLTQEEREEIIKTVNTPEYADLPPSQIVPKLADKGIYLASESTIYRILNQEKMNAHRNRSKEPVKKEATTHIATAPNQVWTWDITWLNAFVKGQVNIGLGVMDSLTLTRGVSSLGYNKRSKPLAVDVTFSVVDFSNLVTAPVNPGIFGGVNAALDDSSPLNRYIQLLASRDFYTTKYTAPKLRLNYMKTKQAIDMITNPSAIGSAMGDMLGGSPIGGLLKGFSLPYTQLN